jgi:hypothetical protein
VIAHFDQLPHGLRWERPQTREQRAVLGRSSADQKVHGDFAASRDLPGTKTSGACTSQRFNQIVLLIEIHRCPPPYLNMVPRPALA